MIFTFYSYKGGVGRTHLLANLAAYLCHYQKRKILMIDWDLEAPGLHYYFDKTDEQIKTKGLIDLMLHFEKQRNQATEENPLTEKDLFFPDENYIQNIVKNENGGKIDLLPATKYEKGFHTLIDAFDWSDFYQNKDGGIYLLWLKEQLKKRSRYDYVFIDSRTGFNDYSGICNVLMPDMNIILVAPNNQNFAGAKTMADRIIHSPYTESNARKPFILPILSKLDRNSADAKEWTTKFENTFAFLIDELDDDIKAYKAEVLEQISALTLLEYRYKFALGEKVQFTEEAPRIKATEEELINFENIALLFLEKMNEEGEINLNEIIGDKMIPVYKRFIKLNPKDYEAYFGLANAYYGVENYTEAITNYQKAIEIKPNKDAAWYNLGTTYFKQENYEEAIKAFQKAIEIKPNKDAAWNNLGTTYGKLQNYEEAIKSFQKAIEIKPNLDEAWNNLGITYSKQENYEEATKAHQKAIEIKPNKGEAWYNLGNTYSKQENYEEAIKAYQKAIEIKPNYHEAWNNLGITYDDLENYEEAIKAYQKVIEIKPN